MGDIKQVFWNMYMGHSTKGEEFLSHAYILAFFSSSNILLLEVCFDEVGQLSHVYYSDRNT